MKQVSRSTSPQIWDRSAYPAMQELLIRKLIQPYGDNFVLLATSKAPRTPVAVPVHSNMEVR